MSDDVADASMPEGIEVDDVLLHILKLQMHCIR